MSEINTTRNAAQEVGSGSLGREKGESSYQSWENADQETQFDTENSETDQEAIFLESCTEKIAMLPIEIAIASFPASLTESGDGFPVSFPHHLFLFMLMLSFYTSVSGIIIWPVFPNVAKGFYFISFVCILLSLTVFFASVLPENLRENGSPGLEQGKTSKHSQSHGFTTSERRKKESVLKLYMCILQATANKIAILPLDITTAFLAASSGTQSSNGFTACFPDHLLLLMLTLGFYLSVNGKTLRLFFPKVAKGFYLVASLCILPALTITFASLLPSNLRDVPRICLTFVLLIVFGLAVYEECSLN
ncbi:hypothetical protein OWV82_020749 [Melia azedarach]|uniref:Uncharacterized protein n=1 Tax=Melia azedarach TaxID=155640 RepID=A0ACC1X938_MELAZ|nr:hypothetical protein OWV82_020749 [Melia azedarach]